MQDGFSLFPEVASTVAADVDRLYLFEVLVSLFFMTSKRNSDRTSLSWALSSSDRGRPAREPQCSQSASS